MDSGCIMKDMVIQLHGGASWPYQGLLDAFAGQISAAVESAITKRIKDGVLELDSLLHNLPKIVLVDKVNELNVSFVNQPLLLDSSVELHINGLFIAKDKSAIQRFYGNYFCLERRVEVLQKCLARVHFGEVDKVPKQSSLTQLDGSISFLNYPNDDMRLNISINSPPLMTLAIQNMQATILLDMIIEVVDNGETIPVARITVEARASGYLEVIGNNLTGQAGLDSFALNLKWSKIGNFHMYLIETLQKTMWVFPKDVAVPYVNARLRKGFPLPGILGFSLEDADVSCSNSRIVVCSDVACTDQ